MARRWGAWMERARDAAAWVGWEIRQAIKEGRQGAGAAWVQAKSAPWLRAKSAAGLVVAASFWLSPVVGARVESYGEPWRSGVEVASMPKDFDKLARGPGYAMLQARAETALRSGEWPLAVPKDEGRAMVKERTERLAHAMSAFASAQEGLPPAEEDVLFFEQSRRIDMAWKSAPAKRYDAKDLRAAFSAWGEDRAPRLATLRAAVGTRMAACGALYIGLGWLMAAGCWIACQGARRAAAARMRESQAERDSAREAAYLAKMLAPGEKDGSKKSRL